MPPVSSLPPFPLCTHILTHTSTAHAIQVVRRGLERVTAAAVLQRNDALMTPGDGEVSIYVGVGVEECGRVGECGWVGLSVFQRNDTLCVWVWVLVSLSQPVCPHTHIIHTLSVNVCSYK